MIYNYHVIFMKKLINKFLSILNKIESLISSQRMKRSPARNIQNILWERASSQSADFVEKYLNSSLVFETKRQLHSFLVGVIKENNKDGCCIEFGVASGSSIRYFSDNLSNLNFYGFDSFIGLKEDWAGHSVIKGEFSQNGVLPKVNSNVKLIKGWFDETLPNFINEYKEDLKSINFVHIDADTYEAAVIIFEYLNKFFRPGMFILFDELIGYPNWKNGEYKALIEAQEKYGFKFKYRAFCTHEALIEII